MRLVFLPENRLNFSAVYKVPLVSAKYIQRTDSEKWVLVDSVLCYVEVDVDIQTKEVRDSAKRLSYADLFAFGIL